mgnify:FL=1
MGIWSLTWFLPPVGGFLTASMAEFVGLGTALTIAASTVSVFAILIWLLSPELRQQKVKEVS